MPTTIPGYQCDRKCDGSQLYNCLFNWRYKTYPDYLADGNPREVTVIEDEINPNVKPIPAPSVVVCYGDKVTVNVRNDLTDDSSTIH